MADLLGTVKGASKAKKVAARRQPEKTPEKQKILSRGTLCLSLRAVVLGGVGPPLTDHIMHICIYCVCMVCRRICMYIRICVYIYVHITRSQGRGPRPRAGPETLGQDIGPHHRRMLIILIIAMMGGEEGTATSCALAPPPLPRARRRIRSAAAGGAAPQFLQRRPAGMLHFWRLVQTPERPAFFWGGLLLHGGRGDYHHPPCRVRLPSTTMSTTSHILALFSGECSRSRSGRSFVCACF